MSVFFELTPFRSLYNNIPTVASIDHQEEWQIGSQVDIDQNWAAQDTFPTTEKIFRYFVCILILVW